MADKETILEREPLYAEVWAEPVRTVAQNCGTTDVGLRKICDELGVPIPPRGYWAKVAAGKKARVRPLPDKHDGQTRYVRRVWVDEKAPEREKRVAVLLAERRPAEWPAVVVPPTLIGYHAVIARMAKRLCRPTCRSLS